MDRNYENSGDPTKIFNATTVALGGILVGIIIGSTFLPVGTFTVSVLDAAIVTISSIVLFRQLRKQVHQKLWTKDTANQDLATNTEDNSVKKAIELVERWMADDSGYDEQTYPQIEEALNQE